MLPLLVYNQLRESINKLTTIKDKGVTIELKEFTDYNQPNEALKNGEIDVNAFQHIYFLNN